MVAVAAELPWPVTKPPEPTDATAVLLLLQTPLPKASDKPIEAPEQTTFPPVMPDGVTFTVTTEVAAQPVDVTIQDMVAVPEFAPVTTPVPEPTDAFALLLLHVMPDVTSVKLVVKPTQTFVVPVIFAGNGLTVKAASLRQVPNV